MFTVDKVLFAPLWVLRSLAETTAKAWGLLRSLPFLAGVLMVCGLICTPCLSWASDYVLVVDTSGSMSNSVSRSDSRIRIRVVENALTDFFKHLPVDSRVYLISFNSGIQSENEIYIRTETDRQNIYKWIGSLGEETKKNGATFLCSTVRKALTVASDYSAQHPSQAVTVWVLTDGGDNEPGRGTENGASKRLNEVLKDFSSIDPDSIRASLTIIGDLALTMTSEKGWFKIRKDVNFANLVPPVIQWTPAQPKTGENINFVESSSVSYQYYDWRLDGSSVGHTKTITASLASEGSHEVRLIVTTANGDKLTDSKRIFISPKIVAAKPKANFTIVPSHPEPGQEVQLIGRTEGSVTKFGWYINGQLKASTEAATYTFNEEATFEIKFHVENEGGFDDSTQSIHVEEPPLLVRIIADAEAKSGQSIHFLNETTGGTPASYEWEFGDGSRSDKSNPNHVFNVIGTDVKEFSVQLKEMSRRGKPYSSRPFQIKIWPKPPKPTAIAHASTNLVLVGAHIQFESQSIGLVEHVMWKFNNEGSSSDPAPLFAFNSAGADKEVVLTVDGPGGSDSAKLHITVVKPDLTIGLNWIDDQGQNTTAPKLIDFGEVPEAHVKSSQYSRPTVDSFDIVIPSDLPSDGGFTIQAGEKATKAIELVRHLPNSEDEVPVTGLIRESGRYRLKIKNQAGEDDYSDNINFLAQGANVMLSGGTNFSQIPIKLKIGTPPLGPLFWLFLVIVFGIIVALLRKALKRKPLIAPGQRMEVTLQEISLTPDGKPTPTQAFPPKTFILSRNHRIYLGPSPGMAPTDHLFDLGTPLGFLLCYEHGLKLQQPSDKKVKLLDHNGEFSVTIGKEKTRKAKLTMRPLVEATSKSPKSQK